MLNWNGEKQVNGELPTYSFLLQNESDVKPLQGALTKAVMKTNYQ